MDRGREIAPSPSACRATSPQTARRSSASTTTSSCSSSTPTAAAASSPSCTCRARADVLRARARARARRRFRRASPARRALPPRTTRTSVRRRASSSPMCSPHPGSTSNTGRQWWKSLWCDGKSSVSESSGSRYRTHTGSSSNSESTSSFVSASDVIPLTRTANRSATRSSQPHRRSRPVTVPNSWPSACTRSWSGPTISLGNGPSPTRVTYAFATPSTSSMRFGPIPKLDGRAGGDRARRGDERIRPVVEVEQRALRAFEEDAFAGPERSVDEERRVRDAGRDPLREAELRRNEHPRRRTARARTRAAARRSSRQPRARASGAGSSDRAGPGRGSRSASPCPRTQGRSHAASSRSAAARAVARAHRRARRARA